MERYEMTEEPVGIEEERLSQIAKEVREETSAKMAKRPTE
jgi:hypothetical protein